MNLLECIDPTSFAPEEISKRPQWHCCIYRELYTHPTTSRIFCSRLDFGAIPGGVCITGRRMSLHNSPKSITVLHLHILHDPGLYIQRISQRALQHHAEGILQVERVPSKLLVSVSAIQKQQCERHVKKTGHTMKHDDQNLQPVLSL